MTVFRDLFTLLARLILGGVLLAHGWQKYNDWTISGVQDKFDQMGVPSPELSAQIATYFELAAGGLLIIGLLVRLVGPILFVQMLGAFWFAHKDSGIFVSDGGWELVGVIGAAGLALAASGAGRISLDHVLATPARRRKEKKEAEARAAENQAAADQAIANQNAAYAAPVAQPVAGGNYGVANTTSAPGTNTNSTPTANADQPTTAFTTPGSAGTAQPADPNAPTTQWPGTDRK